MGKLTCFLAASCCFVLCAASSFSQSLEPFQHVVHTKGGPLKLEQGMPVGTHPHIERALRQLAEPAKKELPPEGHIHHSSSLWGPLATHSLYILSLAPEAQVPGAQDDLLAGLHDRDSVVTSFLPPYSWVVLASMEGAAWLAQQPNTLLVAYPPALKIAPEWRPLLDLIASNDTRALLRVMAGGPLEHSPASPLPERTHEEGGDPTGLIGPLRMHEPTRVRDVGPGDDDDSHNPLEESRSGSSSSSSSSKVLGGGQGSSTSDSWGGADMRGASGSRGTSLGEGGNAGGNTKGGDSRSSGEEGSSVRGVDLGGRRMLQERDEKESTAKPEAVPGDDKGRHFLIEVSFPVLGAADQARLGLCDSSKRGDGGSAEWVEREAWSGAENQAPQQQQQQQQQQLREGAALFSPAQAAAEDWDGALQRVATACGAQLVVEHSTLMVSACSQDLAHVLAWLAARPSVRWLSPSKETMLHNRAAAAAMQSGGLESGQSPSNADLFPYWQAGLDGSGQIIGTGDSGLNMQSCYFEDNAVRFRRTGTRNGFSAFSSSKHRKVVLYVALRGDMSDADGHGTHTSGTLAGSQQGNDPAVSPKEATGMAPGARLAFLDLASGRINGVVTPADLNKNYFPFAYEEGARVHSDSWGSTQSAYDSLASEVDRFLWENQDFTSVFSAGNQGDSRGGTETSVTLSSPSVAKNVISVGATLNFGAQVRSSLITSVQMTVSLPVTGSRNPFQQKTLVVQAGFGGSLLSLKDKGEIRLVGAKPRSACVSFSSSAAVSGRVVLAERGGCQLGEKLRRASDAGAAALIITNDRSSGFFELSGSSDRSTPMGGVPRSVGRYLWDVAEEGGSVSFSERPSHSSPFDQLAAFSSSGPTSDGRIKPDIVAPGRLSSASLGDTCSTNTMQGTSMAAPVVGGSAAIVRQYFAAGFYPTGTRKEEDAYSNPSGALVKAVLLAGASHLRGNVENQNDQHGGLPLEEAPSGKQGFGRVDLSQALPLQGSGKNWRLQVIDKARIKQGESHKYCATATGGPFRVVLAWHDYPGDPAAGTALVNNLDLELRAAGLGGYKLLGNGKMDDSNNVEAVLLESLPQGNVAISVKATRVTGNASPQPYSLVVLGQFSGILQGPDNPVGGGDSRNNTCVITLAEIDRELSTPSLTSKSDISFVFRTESGVRAPGGFQCRLVDEEAVANDEDGEELVAFTEQLHDWRTCNSPAEYTGMPDHVYRFQVRSAGEDVSDALTVQVDSTPPRTTISSSFDFSQEETSADSIMFEFEADDKSAVTFECHVQLDGGPDPPFFRTLPQELTLDQPGPCASPVRLLGLYHGDWTFRVTGTDAAGNVESISEERNTRSWKQRYADGVAYTRLADSPPPLTNQKPLTFKVYSFAGQQDQPPTIKDVDPSEYSLAFKKAVPAGVDSTRAVFGGRKLTAQRVSKEGDTVVVTQDVVEDGDWEFSAQLKQEQGRLQSDAFDPSTTLDPETSFVEADVTVDTTPPVIVIDEQPDSLQTSTSVKIEYSTDPPDDDVDVFECRWLSAKTSPPDGSTSDVDFQECEEAESGVITKDVSEGYWLLQIRGTDKAGNVGDPTNVEFQTDLTAPELLEFDAPSATNSHTVEISYEIDDGQTGSGYDSNMVVCTFSQQQKVPDAKPIPDNLGSDYKLVDGTAQQPCPNPARYAVTEGRYSFRLEVPDRAGNVMERDHMVVVDMRPPVSKVDTPVSDSAEPSEVTITFTSRDFPEGSESGVQVHRCLLQPEGAAAASNGSGRRLSQDGPPRIANGPEVTFGEWQECGERTAGGNGMHTGALRDGSSSNSSSSRSSEDLMSSSRTVMYQNLRSGDYEFRVRPEDASGNVGEPSDIFSFKVDEDLSVGEPSPGRGGIDEITSRTGLSTAHVIIIIVVICVVVGGIILLVLVAIIAKRRRSKRHAQAYAPTNPAQPYPLGPNVYPQPLYAADPYEAQLQREEEARVAQALSLSEAQAREEQALRMRAEEQARVAQALKLSEEQARREEAARSRRADEDRIAEALRISRSQAQSQGTSEAQRLRREEEERLARAMQASIDEENLRKAIEMSLRENRRM